VRVEWTSRALDDYRYWEATDRRLVDRIKVLIADIKQSPFRGIGKPEPLKYKLSGWWSRRIAGEHRLVYRVEGNPAVLTIASARYHY
jgi:toxin YoeB